MPSKGVVLRPVRIARMCDHPECLPPFRRFFFSEGEAAEWSCPEHGRSVVQTNRKYVKPEV